MGCDTDDGDVVVRSCDYSGAVCSVAIVIHGIAIFVHEIISANIVVFEVFVFAVYSSVYDSDLYSDTRVSCCLHRGCADGFATARNATASPVALSML